MSVPTAAALSGGGVAMPVRDLVVIGASAGGLQALYAILGGLPRTLPAAVVIVVHTRSSGVLPQVLGRRSGLPVAAAADGADLKPGKVYVAPADRHVIVGKKGLRVVRGPRENGFRPAVDPLFRTAARSRGPGVIGVILSGALDDGSYGLSAIVRRGGIAIVQDPDEAEVASMPLAALRQTQVHAIAPSSQIADLIVQFCQQPADQAVRPMPRADAADAPEPQSQADDTQVADMMALNGPPSPITCPACGGVLWETEQDGVIRYACHVGHQYAPDSLLAEHGHGVEHALWSAVRVLEQHADLRLRMSNRARDAGMTMVADGFAADSHDYHLQAEQIRQLLFGQRDRVAPDPAAVRRKARAR